MSDTFAPSGSKVYQLVYCDYGKQELNVNLYHRKEEAEAWFNRFLKESFPEGIPVKNWFVSYKKKHMHIIINTVQ